jgi:DNA-binding GntR family transcriptional regulator
MSIVTDKRTSPPATATESVYRTLRKKIVNGKLPPGTRLVHRKLAEQLGTSNIPVIGALRQLESDGLVEATPGEAAQVRRWDLQDYFETLVIRGSLEGLACRLFAECATAEDFQRLEEYNDAFDAATRANDLTACVEADRELHLHIVQATQSPQLIRFMENSGCILMTIRTTMLPPDLLTVGPLGVHQPLLEALKARDPERAEREGRAQVVDSKAYRKLLQYLAG